MGAYGLGFGAAAEAYERYRFAYPEAVADLVLAYADGPVRTALEIGAGTGIATRLFARRGIAVTASDPDAEMLAVLTERCRGLPVRPLLATLESLPPQQPVDLVVAAAALHWTDDTGRWDRICAALRPGGTVASFAGPPALADAALEAAVRAAVDRFTQTAPERRRDPGPTGLAWPGHELLDDARFTAVQEHVVPQRFTVTAPDYVGQLSTTSGYLALAPDRRAEALAAVRRLLPATVEVRADVVLHLARRRP